jgi:hypothetical protein
MSTLQIELPKWASFASKYAKASFSELEGLFIYLNQVECSVAEGKVIEFSTTEVKTSLGVIKSYLFFLLPDSLMMNLFAMIEDKNGKSRFFDIPSGYRAETSNPDYSANAQVWDSLLTVANDAKIYFGKAECPWVSYSLLPTFGESMKTPEPIIQAVKKREEKTDSAPQKKSKEHVQ